MSERGFKYRLEALLKMRGAERDASAIEVRRRAERVESGERDCAELAGAIALAEEELRTLNRSGAQLSLDAQLRLRHYLGRLRERRDEALRDLERARRALHEAVSQLQLRVRDAKALENHRGRSRQRFDEAAHRAGWIAADEQWLRRSRQR